MAVLTKSSKKKIIFVQGATGAGKSHWAFEQALHWPGACIVNCDSVQIYKHVDIGSNKPSMLEQGRVPHYLYSQIDFPDTITAGQFERLFFEKVEALEEEIVFVVGGTGFYFQAIEKGMYPVKHVAEVIKHESDQLIAEKGFEFIYDWIQQCDPEYSVKISRNDHYRIERAYQLMRSENKTMTQIQQEFVQRRRPFPYPLLKVGVREEKEVLREIIVQRTNFLLDEGLIEEVQNLLARGMDGWEPLNSVGYKETVSFLKNGGLRSRLAEEITQNTMKLIKKQKTWFQRDTDIHWVHKTQSSLSVVDSFILSKS